MGTGLYITLFQLSYSSGIDEKEIKKDIKNGILSERMVGNEKLIYYRDAIEYVYSKWAEGKVKMYPIDRGEDSVPRNFVENLLDILDDGFTPAQIKALIKLEKK